MSTRNIIVVNTRQQWPITIEGVQVTTAKEYLAGQGFSRQENLRVFNLCRSYKYQSLGYYVSLLAGARGHHAIPDVATLQDFRHQALTRAVAGELDSVIQRSLEGIAETEISFNIYFGQTIRPRFRRLGKRLYSLFQCPILHVSFTHTRKWLIRQIAPLSFRRIPPEDMPKVNELATRYFSKKRFHRNKPVPYAYDLAILVDHRETSPPSDTEALGHFVQAANTLGFSAELLTRDDFARIPEFDALFIRETTSVNHHTYRFARRAHAEGLIVIDDPWSILKCANKVFLTEILQQAKIPYPKTQIIVHGDPLTMENSVGYPCVLKEPDSAFSRGVKRVDNPEQFRVCLEQQFTTSDLVIAQEFIPSDFDWRIGILDRVPLYACKYYMARNHWQIYNWNSTDDEHFGNHETLPLDKVPTYIMDAAVKAANLIGDGFYGVDLKERNGKAVVIEINDNPNIDAGVEDTVLGEELYRQVILYFLKRIEVIQRPFNKHT